MIKIILLIFSCYKYINRIKKLKSTEYFLELDKYPQIDYYIVYGNPNLETKYKIEDRKQKTELKAVILAMTYFLKTYRDYFSHKLLLNYRAITPDLP